MDVIPSINCADAACAAEKIAVLKKFLPERKFVHLDVTDGMFSPHATWNDPGGWAALKSPFALEAHLMVERPLDCAEDWFVAGARRLVIHVETLSQEVFHGLSQIADRHRGEFVLTSNPDTHHEEFESWIPQFSRFQVLAVSPGAAGQAFLPSVVDKIRFLRESSPGATIEVDGGMNPETARLVKAAGADTLVSANYIFLSQDPKVAFEVLEKI